MSFYNRHIFVCTNQKPPGKKCCANSGGELYFSYLKHILVEKGMHGPGKIRVSKSGCLGRCGLGPCLLVYPEGLWFTYSSESDIDEIVNEYLINGNTVKRLQIDNNPQ